MSSLIAFLNSIAPDQLKVAPRTERANFREEGSPYKPLMLLVVIAKILDRHPGFLTPEVRYADVYQPFMRAHSALCPGPGPVVKPDTAVQPFWKLGAGTPQIWRLFPVSDQGDVLVKTMDQPAGSQVKTRRKLDGLVQYAEFPTSDWSMISDPINGETIISYLLAVSMMTSTSELSLVPSGGRSAGGLMGATVRTVDCTRD